MRALLTALLLLVGLSASASAQTPVLGSEKLTWDQPAASAADAQGYVHKIYLDGSATAVTLSGVTCTGDVSPFVCSVPFPASTPGNHSLEGTASVVVGSVSAESLHSAPFAFVMVVSPQAPQNYRITRLADGSLLIDRA